MESSKLNAVGAYEAKTKFSQLLERVAAGEEITITRHGNAVAKLIPVRPCHSIDRRKEAIKKMRELANRQRLEGLRINDLKAEGRK